MGNPGMGKSTTAGQIALQLQIETPSAELIWVNDRNFDQALQLFRPQANQILVLDDFLGATFLHNVGILAFERDWQALLFRAKQANGQLKCLFTTRNYILEQALTQLEGGNSAIAQLCRQAVQLEHASAKLRAELVYRLVYAAGFTEAQTTTLVKEELYWPLVKATDFSPRLIKMFCEKLTSVPAAQLKSTIEQGIEGQTQLWQHVFKRQSPEAQTLLYLCVLAGNYANGTELKRAFNTLYPQIQGRMAPLNGFDQALIELEPTFITTAQHLNDIWVSPANPSLVDFLQGGINNNNPLIDALIHSLEHFDWGLKNFKIAEGSSSPVALKPKQRDALIDKLLELLTEPGSHLLQTRQVNSLEWRNRPDTFGGKLTKLWRLVMNDAQQARVLAEKLKGQLPATHDWPELYKQGTMAELLDITRYLVRNHQLKLWQLAMHNLNNSEDAAALATFYQSNSDAEKALKPQWALLEDNILDACESEIDRTEDPDHLENILADLYRIEDALELDVRPCIHDIYGKVFEDDCGDEAFDEPLASYYQYPETPDEQGDIERQLLRVRAEVDEMFLGGC
ncbi:hypothetical protein [Marinobacter sp. LV10MA510-1]|uniref:nSTAND3 domain-containing NTPase n=1 Tax=Marinobacter sp. LV10MA510-1 TaxID=1415567 RepID=UPI002B40007D|nr:hypothetical protein [Marinobacter sp. LV10MA510-1]